MNNTNCDESIRRTNNQIMGQIKYEYREILNH